jgi:ribosome assembly protein 1
MSRWLPLSEAILDMIVDHLPSPLDAQKHRIPKIFDTSRLDEEHRNDFKESIENCNNSASNPTVVFVAKMISTSCTFEDFSENQQPKATAIVRKPYQKGKFLDQKEGSDNASSLDNLEDELLKATIRESENEVTSSKSSSNNMEENQNGEEKDSERFIGFSRVFSGVLDSESDLWATLPKGEKVLIPKGSMKLFIFMGKELLPVLKVPAGVVCGILGIDEYVLSYATLSSEENCPSFNQLSNYSAPILKVAVYPAKADSNSMKSLSNGLKLLSHADANVEVSLEASGENVIVACGELHLERCLTDLKERFCKNLDIRVSEPIVSFIETIGGGSKKAVLEVKATPNKWISFGVKAVNLIPQVYEKNWNIKNEDPDNDEVTDFGYVVLPSPEEIKKLLGQHAELSKLKILRTSANGCNFLAWNNEEMKFFDPSNNENDVLFFREIVSSIMSGFEIAMREGPLCNEPMTGVVILIDQVLLERPENWKDFKDPYGPISGQVISAFKDVCRKACESQTSLLVEGMFKLELQCKSEMLGKLYGFLDQRRGRVIREELFPGTDLFVVEGYLPVAESLGFAREVRQKTRGGANPMLILDHWEVVSDKSVSDKNINSVRRRKGLHVNEQVVEHAEKQRTLKR